MGHEHAPSCREAHARDHDRVLEALTRVVTFSCLIENADGHGKNLSFLHDVDGHITLAPLYDTVPTVMWPNLRSTAAMSVNGKFDFRRITVEDIASEASRWGLDQGRALTVAAERIAEGADRLLELRSD